MDPRVKEALREVAHEGPAIPFRTLVRRLRARGMAVNEPVLRRMLEREDSGVRLLEPWSGPHGELIRYLETPGRPMVREPSPAVERPAGHPESGVREGGGVGEGRPGGDGIRDGCGHRVRETWIVPVADDDDEPPDPAAPCALRIRWILRYLGGRLDARSPADVSRWVAMVEEAGRLPWAA